MPITHTFADQPDMLIVEAHGETTQAERLNLVRQVLDDPRHRAGLPTLGDFSDAVSMPTLAELVELVNVLKQHALQIGRRKIAIVTPHPVLYGIARQFGAMAPGTLLAVQIFKDRQSAVAWLSSSPD